MSFLEVGEVLKRWNGIWDDEATFGRHGELVMRVRVFWD